MVQWCPLYVSAPLDEAKLWQSEPIEVYCSIATAGLSHFSACTATADGHHAFACLTRALEIEHVLDIIPINNTYRNNTYNTYNSFK